MCPIHIDICNIYVQHMLRDENKGNVLWPLAMHGGLLCHYIPSIETPIQIIEK